MINRPTNFIEMFNEGTYYVCCIICLLFTAGYINDLNLRENIGWIYLALIGTAATINVINIIHFIVTTLKEII